MIQIRQSDNVFLDNGADPVNTIKIMKIVVVGQFLSIVAAEINHAAVSSDVACDKIITTIVSSIQVRQKGCAIFVFGANCMIANTTLEISAFEQF